LEKKRAGREKKIKKSEKKKNLVSPPHKFQARGANTSSAPMKKKSRKRTVGKKKEDWGGNRKKKKTNPGGKFSGKWRGVMERVRRKGDKKQGKKKKIVSKQSLKEKGRFTGEEKTKSPNTRAKGVLKKKGFRGESQKTNVGSLAALTGTEGKAKKRK